MKLALPVVLVALSMGPIASAAAPESDPVTASSAEAVTPDREQARHLFSAAVSLAKAGRYAAAKALFLEAYAAAPHYLVLYNIAQSELRLGELAAAATDLKRFLDEGGSEIEATRRAAIEAEIDRIQHDAAREPAPAEPLPATSASSAALALSVQPEPPSPALARSTALQADGSSTGAERIAEPSNGSAPAVWSYAVITGGFALLGGAVGLYVWNDARYERWAEENTALLELKQNDLARGIAPGDDAPLRDRVHRNDGRLVAVKRFDPVPVVTAAVGLTAMGLGLWALIDTRDNGVWHLFGDASQLELGARLSW